MNLNKTLIELVDIVSIDRDGGYINMVDITVEGDESFILSDGIISHNSAAAKLIEVRDPVTMAFFPLTGKINNVYGCSPAELLKMEKIANLLLAIGLTPGKPVVRSNLLYGDKIVIATDGDVDGSDILTLLVNLFYMWPELFDPTQRPLIYRLVVPNVCLISGKKRVHIPTRNEFEAVKHKYKNWEVKYYKGLGSMVKADWELVMSNIDNLLIPIVDDGKLKDTLKLLFDDNADARKEWLQSTTVA